MRRHENFIGGSWSTGAEHAENVNPSDTRDVLGLYGRADETQALAAIDAAAARASRSWGGSYPVRKARRCPREWVKPPVPA